MKLVKFFLILLLIVTTVAAQNKNQKKAAMKTQEDSVSYAIGQNIGHSLKDPFMKINFDILYEGIKDALNGQSKLPQEKMENVMNAFNQKMMAKRNQEMNLLKDKNKKEGDEFLTDNKKKEGVVTLPSGLQYKVLASGTGDFPKAADKVKVHYRGTLIDGTEFDSSYGRGEPAVFGVNQVIKGWTEALQLMKVGDKWMLYIPSELAYGENGAGQMIAPNSVLVFEVELLEIVN